MDEEENINEENTKKKEDEQEENKVDTLSLVFQCELHKKFTGNLLFLSDNKAEVKFKTIKEMAVDEHGLVHSSFILAACEYSALAVINKSNVFTQSVEAEYLAPVEVGMECAIKASIKYSGEKKNIVLVQAFNKDIKIFDGTFNLLELEQHILEIKLNEQME